MEAGQTSFDLLAHFDHPKTAHLPDFEWVDEVISNQPPASVLDRVAPPRPISESPVELPTRPTRGIGWVLQWAAALAVLAFAASVLIEFAYLFAAERQLALAARAGALEATLPRATYQSVTAAVERRLTRYPRLAGRLQLTLLQNGSLVRPHFRQNDGDRFSITLTVPNSAVEPDWLHTIMFWRSESKVQSDAERQMPGRKLALGGDIARFGAGGLDSPKQ